MGKCGCTCDNKCEWFDGCCQVDWSSIQEITDNPKCPYDSRYCEQYDGNCVKCIIDHV